MQMQVDSLVTAIFGGLIGLIGAFTALVIAVNGARREAAATAKEVAAAAARMTTQVSEVHQAVNGANTALLAQIERLKTDIAVLTGKARDIAAAEAAKVDMDAKSAITQAAGQARTEAAAAAESVIKG